MNCESLVLTCNGVTPYKTGKLPDGSTQDNFDTIHCYAN